MRYCVPAISLGFLLSACASSGPEASEIETADIPPEDLHYTDLQPQSLNTGECGLFFWTQAQPHRFVVFENESQQFVSIIYDGNLYQMSVVPQEADFILGHQIRRQYSDDETSLSFQISGTVGESGPAGYVLERVVMRVRALDGTVTVLPLTGLRSCQTNAPILVPDGN